MLVCHVNKEDKKIFQKLYATTFVCVCIGIWLGKAKDYGYAYADMLACSPCSPAACSGMVVMICVGLNVLCSDLGLLLQAEKTQRQQTQE